MSQDETWISSHARSKLLCDKLYTWETLEYSAPDGVELSFAHEGDSGMDLRAYLPDQFEVRIPAHSHAIIPTGVCLRFGMGHEVQIRSKSGLASRGISVLNSPGTIDHGYTGEVDVIVMNNTSSEVSIAHGQKIAQAVLCPITTCFAPKKVTREEVQSQDSTRGDGGFGSTGA